MTKKPQGTKSYRFEWRGMPAFDEWKRITEVGRTRMYHFGDEKEARIWIDMMLRWRKNAGADVEKPEFAAFVAEREVWRLSKFYEITRNPIRTDENLWSVRVVPTWDLMPIPRTKTAFFDNDPREKKI